MGAQDERVVLVRDLRPTSIHRQLGESRELARCLVLRGGHEDAICPPSMCAASSRRTRSASHTCSATSTSPAGASVDIRDFNHAKPSRCSSGVGDSHEIVRYSASAAIAGGGCQCPDVAQISLDLEPAVAVYLLEGESVPQHEAGDMIARHDSRSRSRRPGDRPALLRARSSPGRSAARDRRSAAREWWRAASRCLRPSGRRRP